ncbi:hypothetical protein INR49_024216 [Caranx melampygus]|nr:hypothetical protein INR49_024216 [Caranx melampygus]
MIRINNTQYFHFLQQADALRRSGTLCDAIISVKSHTFKAHRLVLACASRRLAQQLAQGDTDCPACCTLEYFSPRTFQQVLDFTYTQALEVSVEDLDLLLKAAQLLEMESLEDQCRKQLDTFDCRVREEGKKEKMTDIKEEKGSAKETHQQKKESPVQDKKPQQTSSTGEEAINSAIMESLSAADSAKNHISSSSPRKKPRLSNMPSKPYTRDSVIAAPVTSSSSFSSPWTFSANMWNSVTTLRRIAENYSNLIAAHPSQSPNQSPIAYPISLSSPPHMFPLLGSHFQNPVHSSVMVTLKTLKPTQGKLKTANTAKEVSSVIQCCGSLPPHHQGVSSVEEEMSCSTNHNPIDRNTEETNPTSASTAPKREKPFECRLCGQRSRDYSAMIKHLRTHDGAAPYQCTVCLEFCSSLVAMQRHVKSHAMQDFPPDWSINSTYLYTSHI